MSSSIYHLSNNGLSVFYSFEFSISPCVRMPSTINQFYSCLYLYLRVLHNLSPLNAQSVPTFHLFPSSHTSWGPNCNIYILQLAFDRTTEVLRLFKFLNIERKTPPRVLDGFFLGYYVRHAHKMTAVA